MRNTIDPSYTTIGMLFEKNFLFEVPKYQRYYSWEDEQVDDFIKDVKGIYLHDTPENTIEHFFGGIVAVEKRIPGSNRQQRELIDGQQRITTTLLLIIALIRKYEKLKDVSNGTLIDNRISCGRSISVMTMKSIESQSPCKSLCYPKRTSSILRI